MKQERLQESILQATCENEACTLDKFLEEIDGKLLDCRKYLDEYKRARLALRTINERLSRLGAPTLPVADHLPADGLGEIIDSRIRHFTLAGKM